jgi:membrane protein implicated in regulation of membrane protease activity
MNENDQRDSLNFIWHKGVIQWGLPMAILFLLAMVAVAVVSGDWSTINGTLVVQSIIFFALTGFCIGLLRRFLSQRGATNKE